MLYFVNPILFPWRWCVSVCAYSPHFQWLKCVCAGLQEISDFIRPPFFPSSFPCRPSSTSPQCFPACLLTHSLLPSCLSDIRLSITSHTLQVWTQIIRAEWLGWGQQWHSPSNLSSDRWCFALPLRHLMNRSSAPLLSPLSVFCFTASLPCLVMSYISCLSRLSCDYTPPPPSYTIRLEQFILFPALSLWNLRFCQETSCSVYSLYVLCWSCFLISQMSIDYKSCFCRGTEAYCFIVVPHSIWDVRLHSVHTLQ